MRIQRRTANKKDLSMCFSATASFSAAAGLTVAGIVGLTLAARSNPRFIPINLLAFFFAIQQFAEGMNWIGSPYLTPDFWGGVFLFFAFFVYPWYFGLSCYYLTTQVARKKWILFITLFGFLYGLALFLNALYYGFQANATCCKHIQYRLHYNEITFSIIVSLYILLTSLPTFISDRRGTTLFGFLIVASAAICSIIYFNFFISVWCFYAAIIVLVVTLLTCVQWWKTLRQFK